MLTIELLPAAHGDAIWIEYGPENRPWRVLIDGGPAHTYAKGLHARIEALHGPKRLELMVVTHIDADHIDGAIILLQERARLALSIGELWFNGWAQLEKQARDTFAPLQGEFLDALIATDTELGRRRNAAFDHGPVVVPDEGALPTHELDGGARLTLLGPSHSDLRRLRARWSSAIRDFAPGDAEEARRRLNERREYRPPATPAVFAAKSYGDDRTVANGSSIAFLFEYEEHAVLFTGDAHARSLAASLRRLLGQRAAPRLRVDAVKVPHHGSMGNVHPEWLALIECERWLVSTNGAVFDHPDEETAELIAKSQPQPVTLSCNYDCPATRRLVRDQAPWSVEFPTAASNGPVGGALLRLPKRGAPPKEKARKKTPRRGPGARGGG